MKNHLGTYECKLCWTLHNTEGSYLAHTHGKKHQQGLAKRAAREARLRPSQPAPAKTSRRNIVKIGRPGYSVTKEKDPESEQKSFVFEVSYPEIAEGAKPMHRIMSVFEQKVEVADKRWQYVLFAAEPYETIAFKIPNAPLDKDPRRFVSHWDEGRLKYSLKVTFKWPSIVPPAVPAAPPPGAVVMGGPPPPRRDVMAPVGFVPNTGMNHGQGR